MSNDVLVDENGTAVNDWSFELIEEYYGYIEKIAKGYGLETYPNQLEVISSEQMLDAYCSVGMPVSYSHWSYGKAFVDQMEGYKHGQMGLAYEIVINSNPCISYLMEENTMMMQVLVMAHACFGHNSFFKNNYLFKQWTDAEGIIDYMAFAKKYISDCEELHSPEEVEEVIDSCHALQVYGVDKYIRPEMLSPEKEKARRKEILAYKESQVNDLWRSTIPDKKEGDEEDDANFPEEPQENILYFIEKNAPNLPEWKREIIRIVRKMSQYFYPQRQTQVMNEGWATFWHYTIMHDLYDEGKIPEGYMLAFYESHTGVVMQPAFDSPYFSGINPYALGFAMFQDIKRVCMEPTDEDKEWFRGQEWVGRGDWVKTFDWVMRNFKDESFIMQFLSPKIMRDMRLFSLHDDEADPKLEVDAIHSDLGYKRVREVLSQQYNIGYSVPDIQVFNVDLWGDRSMTLRHYMVGKRPLEERSATEVLKHLHRLWGYDVSLESVDSDNKIRAAFEISEEESMLDIFLDDD